MKDIDKISVLEQGKLMSKALKIIDELAENLLADFDEDNGFGDEEYDNYLEDLKTLIIKARGLKENRWWKLLT